MGQAVQQRRRHFGVAEDTGPFAESQLGAAPHAGSENKQAIVKLSSCPAGYSYDRPPAFGRHPGSRMGPVAASRCGARQLAAMG